jgi:thiol-disulfide isomerase/thioredoxin
VIRLRSAGAVLGALALLGALAGCSGGSGITPDPDRSDGNTIERIDAVDRGAPLTVSGTTLEGAALSTASYQGKVVVLNYWGSWCQPCIKETPDLKKAWAQLEGKGVQFVGLDAQEEAPTGLAFMKVNDLTYPSLQWDGGKFLLQLKGKAPAPPVTIVLDQQGRLAARVVGPVTTATLVGLVTDLQSGTATDGSTG